jgi:hypothetical protein
MERCVHHPINSSKPTLNAASSITPTKASFPIEVDVAEYFEHAVIFAQVPDADAWLGAAGWANGGSRRLLLPHSAAYVVILRLVFVSMLAQ